MSRLSYRDGRSWSLPLLDQPCEIVLEDGCDALTVWWICWGVDRANLDSCAMALFALESHASIDMFCISFHLLYGRRVSHLPDARWQSMVLVWEADIRIPSHTSASLHYFNAHSLLHRTASCLYLLQVKDASVLFYDKRLSKTRLVFR